MTRHEKIKTLTPEELAEYIKQIVFDLFEDGMPANEEILKYLNQKE